MIYNNRMCTPSFFPTGRCPVDNITGIWYYRIPQNHSDRTSSLPGHLLHYIVAGSYRLKIGAAEYSPEEGDVLYYYGSEAVEWTGNSSAVEFVSVGFTGNSLPVLSADARLRSAGESERKEWLEFIGLMSLDDSRYKKMKMYSALLSLLSYQFPENEYKSTQDNYEWQDIENRIKSNRLYGKSSDQLAKEFGLSRTQLFAYCRAATGNTVFNRIKELRNKEAQGLLKYSGMRIGEIADYLNFSSLHDFSREFKKINGIAPSSYRNNSRQANL